MQITSDKLDVYIKRSIKQITKRKRSRDLASAGTPVTASAFSVQGPEDTCGERAKDSASDSAGNSASDSAGNSVGTRCREDESSRWNGAGGDVSAENNNWEKTTGGRLRPPA